MLSNLTTLALSEDKTTVSIGPGFRWSDVYLYLSTFHLTVGGGHLASVGVPGLLLAGGVTFCGNQYGFSTDQVVSYEIALANGTIVTASEECNADLFWALTEGGSNFWIVTSFEMRTIASEMVWAGIYSVEPESVWGFYAVSAYEDRPLQTTRNLTPIR